MIDNKLVKRLKDAGVSAEIILGLMLEDEPEPEKTGGSSSSSAPAPSPAPVIEEKKAEPAPATGSQMDAVLAAIQQLTGAVQAQNRRQTMTPPETQTSADILAQMMGGKPNA